MRTGLLVVITILAAPLANQVLPGTGGHTFAARAQSVEGRIEDRHKFENPRVNGQVVDRCLNSTSNQVLPGTGGHTFAARAQSVEGRIEDRHKFENPRVNGQVVDRCLNSTSN